MKKLLFTILFFVLTPLSALASINYSRSPSETSITSPVQINLSFNNWSDFGTIGGINDAESYYIDIFDQNPLGGEWYSSCNATTTLSISPQLVIPTGRSLNGVYVIAFSDNGCNDYLYAYALEFIDNDTPIFTIISSSGGGGGVLFGTHYPENGTDDIGTSTTGLLAAVGFVSSDTFGGIFPYLMLSIGVFTGFYVIQKLAMIFGSMSGEKVKIDKEQAQWSGKGVMEHEQREWRKKARSRKKRGLDIE
jgi:hypothetical protein